MKCFYCECPLDFIDMEVDHVIPERFSANPEELAQLDRDYGLGENFPGFSISSFQNCVPTHGSACNSRKGDELLPKAAALFFLSRVHQHLARIDSELFLLRKSRRKQHILGQLFAALERNDISRDELFELLDLSEESFAPNEPLVIAFGLNIREMFDEDLLPDEAPGEFPYLYDWLEEHLEIQLRACVSTPFQPTEPSLRNGECLTVRIVFPEADTSQIPRYLDPNWEILEAMTFHEIYGEPYARARQLRSLAAEPP